MEPIMLIYKMEEKSVVMTIEHAGTLASMVAMCRECDYPYEIYNYSEENGFQRTACWPPKI